MSTSLHLKVVKNDKDIDVIVKDAFGNEHVLFPNEEKRLMVLVKGKKHGASRTD